MEMVAGWFVCLGLWGLGWILGAPATIGLLGALAFGSTAIGSLGGSTVPAFVAQAGVLLALTVLHRNFWRDLSGVLESQPLAYLICAIVVYAVATSIIFPRLFADQTTVFVPVGAEIVEAPLRPVSGNINRAAYLVLDCLVFLALCILLRQGRIAEVRRGFLAFAAINAALGLIDVVGKLVGMGDVLGPIRTADYNMLTEQTAGDFFRIMGGFPEPSAYAAAGALPAIAFVFMDWRITKSRVSLTLALVLLTLLLFSTSSTAYASLGILLSLYSMSSLVSFLRGRVYLHHVVMFAMGWMAITLLLAVYVLDERQMDPIVNMLMNATVNKQLSGSALERGMWNAQSIQNFLDTFGVGVGLGSTRSSSWPISVIAQLGVIGGVAFAIAVGALAMGLLRWNESEVSRLSACASAAGLAWICGSSFGGSGADPNMIFFAALATVSASMAERRGGTQPVGLPRPRLASARGP
jgi:hypothetical protein